MPRNNPIQPMHLEESKAKKSAIGIMGAGALLIATPFIAQWEGKRNDPYRDIVGVATVCYGDTRNVTMGKRVSDAECTERLYAQIADHAAPVIKCVPQLKGHDEQLAASVSLAYNIGTNAFCKSTVAKRFRAGNFQAACNGFIAWRFAGGREVRGLKNRREKETALCLTGLS